MCAWSNHLPAKTHTVLFCDVEDCPVHQSSFRDSWLWTFLTSPISVTGKISYHSTSWNNLFPHNYKFSANCIRIQDISHTPDCTQLNSSSRCA
jgi:hypothetical protein